MKRQEQQVRKNLQDARYAACRASETAYAARKLDDAHRNHRYWEGWWRWTEKQVNAARRARVMGNEEAGELETDGLMAMEQFKLGVKPFGYGRSLPASAWAV